MFKNFLLLLTLITHFFMVYGQERGTKVSYATGISLLKDIKFCSQPQWRKYDSGLEYVEVKALAKHCQQFSDYLIPQQPAPNRQKSSWGTGSSSPKPMPGHILLGQRYEVTSETEIFVQVLTDRQTVSELEEEVLYQCRDWVKSLGKIEPSNKLPQECK